MSDTKSPTASSTSPSPLPPTRLKQITTDACTLTLEDVTAYDHSRTASWNTAIINHILRALISESTPTGQSAPPFKFVVNSAIIQHLGEGGEDKGKHGRRGMHSACGAYWNTSADGMWSEKWEGRGMDVVVSVVWIAV